MSDRERNDQAGRKRKPPREPESEYWSGWDRGAEIEEEHDSGLLSTKPVRLLSGGGRVDPRRRREREG